MTKLSLNYTGIGSLPFKGEEAPVDAIEFIFDNYTNIPFWPQLPHFKRCEDMVLQFTQNLAGFEENKKGCFINQETETFFEKLEELYFDFENVISSANLQDCAKMLDKYAITAPYSNTFALFTEKLKEYKPPFIKGSITGPFTFSTSINCENGKCAFYDETIRDMIVKTLALKALWQIKEFKKASSNSKPIIFMDEPSVSQVGSCAFLTVKNEDVVEMIRQISDIIKKFGGMTGIHCCGKTDWNVSINADVDIINFDAFSFAQNISTYAEQIKNFIEHGGFLAFGIIPTLDKEALRELDENKIMEKFEESLNYLIRKKIPRELILKQSFITPSCGCGSLSIREAVFAVQLTKKLSESLRGVK